MIISVPLAPLFKIPSKESEVVSEAIYGFSIEILKKENQFLKIRTTDDYEGWIEETHIAQYKRRGCELRISSLFAKVYASKDWTLRREIMTLPFNAHVDVTLTSESMVLLHLPDRVGWVFKTDLDIAPQVKSLTSFYPRFLGLPYTWGGVSPFGFDCSGFVQMIFRELGVNLPRDSTPQSLRGIKVEKSNLREGDLLFFGINNKINHVAIYIGLTIFVHSTTAEDGIPGVRSNSLLSPFWQSRWVAAKRILPFIKP
jgi:hypothetical protein